MSAPHLRPTSELTSGSTHRVNCILNWENSHPFVEGRRNPLPTTQARHGVDEVKVGQLSVEPLQLDVEPVHRVSGDLQVQRCLYRPAAALELPGPDICARFMSN